MKLLHTGAFAKLCGVRKGTLLFYDKEGVLRPKYISGNGYRRYGMDQYYEFALLSLLKDTGGSLKEIKGSVSACRARLSSCACFCVISDFFSCNSFLRASVETAAPLSPPSPGAVSASPPHLVTAWSEWRLFPFPPRKC